MNTLMTKALALLAIVGALSLQGCMTYSQHELAPVQQWPLETTTRAKPNVYLKVQSEYMFNENRGNATGNIQVLEKLLTQEFLDSQRFSRVTTQQQTADVYVTATLRNHEEGSFGLAFLTGFTLFLVPSKADNTFSLELAFQDAQGKKLGQVTKHEKLTTWMHLVLIFAVPFNESTDKLVKELARSALEEAAHKGLI